MNKSESINELSSALSKTQSEICGATKDSTNPFFNSKFATLQSVWDACRGPLTKNGLAVIQTTNHSDGKTTLVTTLAHSSGQWVEGYYPITPVKTDPQSLGSAMSYARRYSLMAIIGIPQVDDDAEKAMGRSKEPQKEVLVTDGNKISTNTSVFRVAKNSDVYTIPFGKFKGKRLEDISPDELGGYLDYLEERADKEGKEITGQVKEFIDLSNQYLSLQS